MAVPVVASTSHTNGSTTTVVIAAPSGIQDGDLLLAGITTEGGSGVTAPGGWTNLYGGLQAVFYKIAASESGSYTFTGGSGAGTGGFIARITGVDGTSPINASNSGSGGPSTAYSISGITTTVANCLLIQTIFVANGARTITAGPAVANNNPTWTNTVSADDGTAKVFEYDGSYPTAGATGVATATFSGSTGWFGGIIAISPPQSKTVNVTTVALSLSEPPATPIKSMAVSVINLVLGLFAVSTSNSDSKWTRDQKHTDSWSTSTKSATSSFTTTTKSSAPTWTDQTKT